MKDRSRKDMIRKEKNMRMFRAIFLRMLAVFLTVGLLMGGEAAKKMPFFGTPVIVQAASGKVTLSKILSKCGIDVLDRPSSEGLWCIRVGGKKTFCLNSGKAMNTGDTADGKTHDAATYKNQSLAKVLTYYFGEKDQGGGTKTFLLCQAYVWACGKGVSKKTAMIEAGKNLSISKKAALAVYDAIENTDPYGKIIYYTIKKCSRNIDGSYHQHLVRWTGTKPVNPEYGSYKKPYSAETSEKITLKIEKKDTETGVLLDGAVFEIYRDNKKVTTVTAKNGKASYTYTASYSTSVKPTKSYIWVKNWNALTKKQQEEEKKKGYYSSEAKAIAACLADLKPKAAAALAALKTATHTWKIKEVNAPKNHALAKSVVQTWKETGKATGKTLVFQNTPVKMTLQITKKSSEAGKNQPSLAGAVYALYADETILGTDLRTEKYHKGNRVGTVTTDADGKAVMEGLLPGKYVLQEEKAPEGYLLNTEKISVDLTAKNQTELSQKVSAAVTDTPIKGKIHIKKTFAGQDEPVHLAAVRVKDETYTPGLCEHHLSHTESCGYQEDESGDMISSCGYTCEICSYKEEMKEEALPITDRFALLDSQGNTVDTIVIGADGEGNSDELYYGTYTLHQTESTTGYDKVPDMAVTINESEQMIGLALDDPKEEAAIYLTKSETISDKETGTYIKKPEQDAVFEVYDPEGRLVKTMTTNENGIAFADGLEVFGTYTIKQIKGDADYQLMSDGKVSVTLNKAYYVAYEDSYTGSKIRIKKLKKQNKEEPEAGAVFYLLKAGSGELDLSEMAAMTESADRTAWIGSLSSDTVIARLQTDENGEAAAILDQWCYEEHPEGFILYQTEGEEGFALQDPVESSALSMETEDGVHVFSYTATDLFDDWGNISLIKYKTISESKTAPETGAQFTLTDSQGNIVAIQTADENGLVTFERIPFGTYQLSQEGGDADHEMMAPQSVTLTEEDKHKTVSIADGPVIDQEKDIRFLLTKYSSETKAIVSGARYELYKITENEDKSESKELITTLLTGEENTDISLPYGSYLLKEIYPADGFELDPEEYTFTLDQTSVKQGENGETRYEMDVYDKPITGTIAVNKKGDTVTGYSKDQESFKNEISGIAGATYGLYAREDILQDDGSVAYAAGTLIDEKMTDRNGYIQFTRTDGDGTETEEFLLGSYYVKEIKAPDGYQLDAEEHDVVLTWDHKTEQFEDVRESAATADVEEPVGNNTEDQETEKYMLISGERLNAILKEIDPVRIVFTMYRASAAEPVDVSMAQDGSVTLWTTDAGYCYITTQKQGKSVILPPDASHMFDGLTNLSSITFDTVDTTKTVDMSYMFRNITGINELDLAAFDMSGVEDVTDMFASCSATVTNFELETVREAVYEEDIKEKIEAAPKNEFSVGHVYTADDFIFTRYYTNGKCEEVTLTDEDVTISPDTAAAAGQEKVTFTFTGDTFGSYPATSCTTEVVDPDTLDASEDYSKPEVTLDLAEESQPISIQLVKADEDDDSNEMLSGAEFTLYAACDIVDKNGTVIAKEDQVLETQTSGGEDFTCIEFSGLPSEIYKKDPSAEYMYYIRETKAPDGYYGNDKTIYITGKIIDAAKNEQVYGWSNLPVEAADSAFSGSEEHLYKNKKVPYLVLKKEWVDDNESGRPKAIHVTVTLPDGTKREFTLTEESDWTLITDIDSNLYKGLATLEIEKLFKEETVSGYAEDGSSYDKNLCVYTFRNTPVSVPPVWFTMPLTGKKGLVVLPAAVIMAAVGMWLSRRRC